MEEQKKTSGRGGYRGGVRPTTNRKIPLMVRISQEAADRIATVKNKSEYVDGLIRADN